MSEIESDMDTTDLIDRSTESNESGTVDMILPELRPPNLCGVRLKTAAKTSACLIAVGLAFVTIGVIVEVISAKTQTGHMAKVARHWKETPLDVFGIFFIVFGGCSLMFGIFTMVRVALVVRKIRKRNDINGGRERTVTSVSGYVQRIDNEHRLESFPSLDEGTGHGFIRQFIRKK